MADLESLAAKGSEEEALLRRLDRGRLPRHVAVIMDGNGRWARKRHLPRVAGHRAGIRSVRETVESAARLGIEVLTLYAFSQENWKRPRSEVDTLMDLLREYLRKELGTLTENRIRFSVIGRMGDLHPQIQEELLRAIEETAPNDGLRFNIALSYGGRAEIVDACRAVVAEGLPPGAIDEAAFADRLYTAGQPDPDLLIRTSGEHRVSNFLLWQIAYAEIHVTPTLWPDFRLLHLLEALVDYQGRERRYGGIGAHEPSPAGAAGGRTGAGAS
jgi:undecaprenyl diphosphate synthase